MSKTYFRSVAGDSFAQRLIFAFFVLISTPFLQQASPSICVDDLLLRGDEEEIYKLSNPDGEHAFWLHSLPGDRDYDIDGNAYLVIYEDGTAALVGSIVNQSNSNKGFELEISFEIGLNYDQAINQGLAPKNDILNMPNSVVKDWRFFEFTSDARIIGQGDCAGEEFYLKHKYDHYVFQLGLGANDKDEELGASAWLTFDPSDPDRVGDINVSLTRVDFFHHAIFGELDESTPETCAGVNDGALAFNWLRGDGDLTITLLGENGQVIDETQTDYQADLGCFHATGLAPGDYTLVVGDQNSCSGPKYISANVAEGAGTDQLAIWPKGITNASSCNSSNGKINISAIMGGTGQYTAMLYTDQIDPTNLVATKSVVGSTGFSFSNLVGGNYFIEVSDGSDCSTDATLSLPIKAGSESPLTCTQADIQPECHSRSMGSITFRCKNDGDWNFQWYCKHIDGSISPLIGETRPDLINRRGGTYILKGTNGCFGNIDWEFEIPKIFSPAVFTQPKAPECHGEKSGMIISSGVNMEGVTYKWYEASDLRTVISTEQHLTNVTAGSYKLRVYQPGSCGFVASSQATIPEAPDHQVVASITSSTADDCATATFDGSMDLLITCTDGCYPLAILVNRLNDQGTPVESFATTNPKAGVNSYANLPSGRYQFTISDQSQASGIDCTSPVIIEHTIAESNDSPLIVDNSMITYECNASSDGTLMLTPQGGRQLATDYYTYQWSGPSTFDPVNGGANVSNDGSSLQSLTEGTYQVTVTERDENDIDVTCTNQAVFTYEIYDIPEINLELAVTQPVCGMDGVIGLSEITRDAFTGSFDYEVKWYFDSDGDGNFGDEVELSLQTPTSVQFDNGELTHKSGSLEFPGTAIAQSSTQTVNAARARYLMAGDYQVVVSTLGAHTAQQGLPAGNCSHSVSQTVTLETPTTIVPISAQIEAVDPACNGDMGIASVTAMGGKGDYSYAWYYHPLQDSDDLDTEITANDCPEFDTNFWISLNQIEALEGTTINGAHTGTTGLQVTIPNGLGETGQGTSEVSNLRPGFYKVIIADQSSCSSDFVSDCTFIQEPELIVFDPITVNTSLVCQSEKTGQLEIDIDSNCDGEILYEYYFNATISGGTATTDPQVTRGATVTGTLFGTNNTGSYQNLETGLYTVVASDGCDCSEDLVYSIYIEHIKAIELNDDAATDVTGCAGTNSGKLILEPIGGGETTMLEGGNCAAMSDYTFVVTDENNSTITSTNSSAGYLNNVYENLPSGTYQVEVTSACAPADCNQASFELVVNDIPKYTELIWNTATTHPQCVGGVGSITVNDIWGGTGRYAYELRELPNAFADNFIAFDGNEIELDNLTAGSYEVQIRDLNRDGSANACVEDIVTTTLVVTEGDDDPIIITDSWTASSLSQYITCDLGESATITDLQFSAAFEEASKSYFWNVVNEGENENHNAEGSTDPDDQSVATGNLVGVTSGVSVTLPELSLPAGDYTLIIKDKDGCNEARHSFQVFESNFELIDTDVDQIACDSDGDVGAIHLTFDFDYATDLENHAAPTENWNYRFVKDDGDLTFESADPLATVSGSADPNTGLILDESENAELSFEGLSPGYYYLEIVDPIGGSCTACKSIVVGAFQVKTAASVTAIGVTSATDQISCNGAQDGEIEAGVFGGVGPYTYAWRYNDGASLGAVGSNVSDAIFASQKALPGTASIPDFSAIEGQGSPKITNLPAAEYLLKVTDASDCTTDLIIIADRILEPAILDDITVANVINSTNDCGSTEAYEGVINFTSIAGGSGIFSLTIVHESGSAFSINGIGTGNYTATDLQGGSYDIEIVDESDCSENWSGTVDVVIDQLVLDESKIAKSEPSCYNSSDGSISLAGAVTAPPGSSVNYDFQLETAAGVFTSAYSGPSANFINAEGGYWKVVVTASIGGCNLEAEVACSVSRPAQISVANTRQSNGNYTTFAQGGTGTLIFSSWQTSDDDGTTWNVVSYSEELPNPGVGTLIRAAWEDENGCEGFGASTVAAGRPVAVVNVMKAYPNPAPMGSDITVMANEDFDYTESFEIEAYDFVGNYLGKPNYNIYPRSNEIVVETNNLYSGSGYYLKLVSSSGNVGTIKVLILE